ncbi:hypothetical protein BJP35_3906 [Enterobacter sp. J49]|nr:hypothetical protein BJP35_3906 [Enterobacter sp. J49]
MEDCLDLSDWQGEGRGVRRPSNRINCQCIIYQEYSLPPEIFLLFICRVRNGER